ncbi:hypothetical protein DLJ53_17600 [Acuticoccus sediminis]|uniref:Uncharacterized protein n=1 Tax=Acuticoccus sediminis TaxID=2184697 RepID=A0A8B2NUR8_9HYPH|nr:hypothetical protein [Acuticoccus sediminis]RAI01035.1 hypothetical protein DLJ53_17600 [Acuticoccus sediminis]
MIVFIEIPFSAGRGAFQAFTKALGAQRVGWLGRNATLEDLTSAGAADKYALVGGRFTLDDALKMQGVTRFATVAGDPILRMISTWNAWERQHRHPDHWVPHTFSLREALDERVLPVMVSTEAMMRSLRKKGVGTEIDRIMADLTALPVTVGFGDQPEAFAETIAEQLGLGPDDLNPNAFAEFGRAPNNTGLYQSLVNGTVPDRTLHMRLLEAAGDWPVWTTH